MAQSSAAWFLEAVARAIALQQVLVAWASSFIYLQSEY